MDDPSDRLINTFGALSQAVSDRVRMAIAEAFGAGGETAAALIAIGHEPGMSIGQIRQILRLSHAGAVRVVERLGHQGLVAKSLSPSDRRVVRVILTLRGQDERTKLLDLRRTAIAALLDKVSPDDRVALERAADAVLSSVFRDRDGGWATCRLCDRARCRDCPVDRHRPL
ncbi:MarR family winged helix-turn-helix transcriptional regulator [Brevundimonas sp.]|uniref:MarR family winged helix-turn-helix transcriptional regulator n=1 Tax=Brevundimonas sp. TaxID=1871086 RepID=UPI0035670CC0